MRKTTWALVLALVVGAIWWARERGGELVAIVPTEAREAATPASSSVELAAGAAAAPERNAVEEGSAPPRVEAGPPLHAPSTIIPSPTSATLEGEVVDPSGGRVSARIELVHAETGVSRATGMALEYRFDDVEPGPWWVRVTGDLRSTVCERIELELGPNRKDFVLPEQRAIEVHLETSAGEPLTRVLEALGRSSWRPHVFATLEPPGTERLDGSDADRVGIGWFEDGHRFSAPDPVAVGPPWDVTGWPEMNISPSWVGTLHLSVDAPVYVAAARLPNVLDSLRVEPGTTRVTLRVDIDELRVEYASVQVRVAAADTGELLTGGWFVRLASWTTISSSTPTPDGAHRFDRVQPGRYSLSIVAAGFVGKSLDIELAPGEERDVGTIGLERIDPSSGRVLDPLGRGVAVQIEYRLRGPSLGYLFALPSDASGRFALPISHEDGAELRVRPAAFDGFAGELASRIVGVDAGAGDVVVQLARCSRLVLRPTGCTGWRYEVVDEQGSRYANGAFRDPAPVAIELPVGWYEVVLVDDAGVERRHALQLGELPSLLDVLGG